MKVSLKEYHLLQDLVYDGLFSEDFIGLYTEFADFCETPFERPEYTRLLDGLINLKVEQLCG